MKKSLLEAIQAATRLKMNRAVKAIKGEAKVNSSYIDDLRKKRHTSNEAMRDALSVYNALRLISFEVS